jgi:hypothetical protein
MSREKVSVIKKCLTSVYLDFKTTGILSVDPDEYCKRGKKHGKRRKTLGKRT